MRGYFEDHIASATLIAKGKKPGDYIDFEKKGCLYYVRNGRVQVSVLAGSKALDQEPIEGVSRTTRRREIFVDEIAAREFFGELEIDYLVPGQAIPPTGLIKVLTGDTQIYRFGEDMVREITQTPQYLCEIIEQVKRRYATLSLEFEVQSIAHNDPVEKLAKLAAVFMLFFSGKVPSITTDTQRDQGGKPLPSTPSKKPIAHFLVEEKSLAQWMGLDIGGLTYCKHDSFSERPFIVRKRKREIIRPLGVIVDRYKRKNINEVTPGASYNLAKQFQHARGEDPSPDYIDDLPCPRLLYLRDRGALKGIQLDDGFPEDLFRVFCRTRLNDFGLLDLFSFNSELGTRRSSEYRDNNRYPYIEVLLTDPYSLEYWSRQVTQIDWAFLGVTLGPSKFDTKSIDDSYQKAFEEKRKKILNSSD